MWTAGVSDHDLLYSNVGKHHGEESGNMAAFPTAGSRGYSRNERNQPPAASTPTRAPKTKAKARGRSPSQLANLLVP